MNFLSREKIEIGNIYRREIGEEDLMNSLYYLNVFYKK